MDNERAEVAYIWTLEQTDVSHAVLAPESCKPSDKLRIALDRENEVSIVAGMSISDRERVLKTQVQ